MSYGKGNNKNKKFSSSKPSTPRFGDDKRKKSSEGGSSFSKDGNKKFGTYKGKPKFEGQPKPKVVKSLNDEIRLNKYIANSGACSRRDADIYIQSGNVSVNGVVVTEMGYKVKPSDKVVFDGSLITPEKKEYILLNKPKGFSTIGDADKQTSNVMDLVRMATKAKIQPIGRMDKSTTGLLLFTNDSDIVRKFNLPQQRSPKVYQVSLDKNLKYEDLEKVQNGIHIDEHRIHVDEIDYVENQPKSEIGIKLGSANVKVVRNIFEHLGYNVLKVDRVMFAGLTKKNLPRGTWRFLTEQEIINLKNA
ncbi:rRNA pseudouridine synthase [Flavobacterium agricola]|uniref:rRNA pseudouridine synthase n=1 Tax=Flavobacterium agricola TaxID=2870839 RepID=A0ABY6LY90_9FLAO|nr:pseudouridine synthase [Flavobacterium agricola]UYW01297.1 rRNA pseudouridine synthase [Flavobacterium agricola]